MQAKKLYIGTSGWSYLAWKGRFYPASINNKDMLVEYCHYFPTTEINNSFYRLPTKETVSNWYAMTPKNFVFSWKASRYLTHLKKLSDCTQGLYNLFDICLRLKEKLGPILFQLPPHWKLNLPRLQQFINALPTDLQYTFEFREKSWLCPEVYELLQNHKIALCFYDYKGFQPPEILTTDFVYLRLHGSYLHPYQGHYLKATLKQYAKKIISWKTKINSLYCYFDNDQKAAAPQDAQTLLHLLCQ